MTMDRTLLFLLVFLTVVCLSQRRPGNVFCPFAKRDVYMYDNGRTDDPE